MSNLRKKFADAQQLDEIKNIGKNISTELHSVMDGLTNIKNELSNELIVNNGNLIGINPQELQPKLESFMNDMNTYIQSLDQIQ